MNLTRRSTIQLPLWYWDSRSNGGYHYVNIDGPDSIIRVGSLDIIVIIVTLDRNLWFLLDPDNWFKKFYFHIAMIMVFYDIIV